MRFDRIVEIVNRLEGELKTAVDLGGNQGRFSRLLVQRTRIQRAICVDSDEGAIDKGYNGTKQAGGHNIAYCHYDFMGVIAKLRFALPTERFKSDVAFALALTHHLLLTHGYELDHVFRSISAYARRYVFIEFMPRGLWPTEATPQLPSWYTRDWFRQSFATHFEPVLEENLRENNVLFVGRVRPDSHQMPS